MNDHPISDVPVSIPAIEADTQAIGFSMASDRQTGALLRTLAATKPGGRIIELGTGTGLSTAWIVDGMDAEATLDTVDNDAALVDIARRHLGGDERVRFHVECGEEFIDRREPKCADFIFADTWPGKYHHLEQALELLAPGGLYVIDDMLPQPDWPEDHRPKVPLLIETLESRRDLVLTKLNWSTGIIVAVKRRR